MKVFGQIVGSLKEGKILLVEATTFDGGDTVLVFTSMKPTRKEHDDVS